MKKCLIIFIGFFTLFIAVGNCSQMAPQGPSPKKIIPADRKGNPVSLPVVPQATNPSAETLSVQAPPPYYNPIGKPDPFMPTKISAETKKNLMPLEQFEVKEFELVGVVTGFGLKKAMVQDLTGKGFFIQVGTRIGKMGGKVVRITEKEVVVKEPYHDFLGRRSFRVISLKLPQTP